MLRPSTCAVKQRKSLQEPKYFPALLLYKLILNVRSRCHKPRRILSHKIQNKIRGGSLKNLKNGKCYKKRQCLSPFFKGFSNCFRTKGSGPYGASCCALLDGHVPKVVLNEMRFFWKASFPLTSVWNPPTHTSSAPAQQMS